MQRVSRFAARQLLGVAVVAALAGAVLAVPVQAAFPGANGKLAFCATVDGAHGLYTLDPDGTGPTQLTNTTGDCQSGPVWSASGKQLAVITWGDFLDVINADGSGRRTVTADLINPVGLTWSPDMTQFIWSEAFTDEPPPVANLFRINVDGTGLTRITGDDTFDFQPAWSPDGSKIAFQSFRRSPDTTLFSVSPDGTGITAIPSPASGMPDWSPDGSKLALLSSGSNERVYVANADGSNATPLTDPGANATDWAPVWSPDGKKIAFARCQGVTICAWSIYVMNADGTGQTSIADVQLDGDGELDWQPIPGPQRSDYKHAAQFCKAERDFLGESSFRQKYGGGANAYGKCASGKS